MSAFCTSCGSPLQDGVAFCNQCGHRLSAVSAPVAVPQTHAAAFVAAQPAPEPKESHRLRSVVFFVLAVVCLVGAGIWGWTQYASGTAPISAHSSAPTRAKSDPSDLLTKLASAVSKADAEKDSGVNQAVAEAASRASDALDPASPNDAASAAAAKNACSLLSVDELSSGVGSSYSKAEPSSNGEDEISCEYTPGEGNIYPATLTVTLKNGKATMETLRGVGTQMIPGTKAESDLGDASFYMPMDVGIYALKGDTLVSLQFGLGKGTRDQKKALVQKVLSRL